jgi:ketosteroid isomerase-like protein
VTAREAFERGTATFNDHDIDGFTRVLADEVVFRAPGEVRGEGKEACAAFFGSWFAAFSDAHVEVQAVHFVDDVAVEEGRFTGTQDDVLRAPGQDIPRTGRFVKVDYIQVLHFRDGKHASFNRVFDRLQFAGAAGPRPGAPGGTPLINESAKSVSDRLGCDDACAREKAKPGRDRLARLPSSLKIFMRAVDIALNAGKPIYPRLDGTQVSAVNLDYARAQFMKSYTVDKRSDAAKEQHAKSVAFIRCWERIFLSIESG